MSELAIAEAIQDTLQAITAFADASVVINDWRILDGSLYRAPFVIIETADTFTSRQDTIIANNRWEIPITLFERFTDWKETYDNLRTRRQAIIDEFNEVGANRAPGGGSVTADVIRSDSPIGEYYDPHSNPDLNPMPLFVIQRIVLEVEEY